MSFLSGLKASFDVWVKLPSLFIKTFEFINLSFRHSYLPKGLANEIKSMLKQKGMMTRRDERIKNAEAYLFHHGKRWNKSYSEKWAKSSNVKLFENIGLFLKSVCEKSYYPVRMVPTVGPVENAHFEIVCALPGTSKKRAVSSTHSPAEKVSHHTV